MALISGEKTFRALYGEKVNPQDKLKAALELNETPESVEVALRTLKDMLGSVQNLNACLDDDYLLFFLRARKFDIDRAFSLLQNFYGYRAQYPELLQNSSQVEALLRNGLYYHLPYRDEEGRAISVLNISSWDPDVYSFWDMAAAIMLSSESILWFDPVTQINGIVNICDVQGFSKKIFLEMSSPRKLSVFSTILTNSNPARVSTILVINTPQLVETLWTLVKPLIPKKFGDRVHFLGSDMKDLHQFLDPAILPQEYGGKLPSRDYQKFVQLVRDREDYTNYVRQFGFVKTEETEVTEKYTKLNEDDIW
ncbi:alpha-tocopherol transfer protein-like [Uloborus diversus]|uniref:alpha-tocopherol transfer protein-like n=1 Tax=Uloborus diversus TaxID=327109 RepID=UPI00240A9252|nr:alpha-tocopherol transfer protein-like [Uloborus diversus]